MHGSQFAICSECRGKGNVLVVNTSSVMEENICSYCDGTGIVDYDLFVPRPRKKIKKVEEQP